MNRNSNPSRLSSRRGQAAVLMALSITATLGLMGLVVDVGWAYWRKLACKTAAQAATMAAVKKATNPYSAQASISCASLSTGPLYVGCQYASTNGFTDGGNGGKQTVKIAAGTTTGFPLTGISGVTYWVTATVSEQVPEWFTAVLGGAMTVSARSTAATLASSGGGGCVYALATSGTAIYESGGGALTSGCGVYVNSNADTVATPAINLQPSSSITASGGSKIYIATGGGYVCGANLNGACVNGSTMSPMPTSAAAATDPVGPNLPTAPTAGSCASFSIPTYGTYVLPAGTYCSQVSAGGSVTLQLSGGLYYLENGISIGAGATMTCTGGSTLYVASGAFTASGSSPVTLTAPTSGTYNGLAVWQPSGNATTSSLGGSASLTVNGLVYMPKAQFNYSGTGSIAGTNLTVVANSYYLTGSAHITNPASSPYFNGGGGPSGNFLLE